MTGQVGQVGQATLICPRSRLFSEWKARSRNVNRETLVPLVPSALPHTASGVPVACGTESLAPPPSPILSDYAAFRLADIPTDPLYCGRLEGRVPPGWSRDGWIAVTHDRMRRTDDKAMRGRLHAELRAVEPSPQGRRRAPLRSGRRAGARTPPERENAANTAWA